MGFISWTVLVFHSQLRENGWKLLFLPVLDYGGVFYWHTTKALLQSCISLCSKIYNSCKSLHSSLHTVWNGWLALTLFKRTQALANTCVQGFSWPASFVHYITAFISLINLNHISCKHLKLSAPVFNFWLCFMSLLITVVSPMLIVCCYLGSLVKEIY